MNKFRTHNCSELNEKEINKMLFYQVGFIEKEITETLLFIDLRDHYGITQCVIENNSKYFSLWKKQDLSQF